MQQSKSQCNKNLRKPKFQGKKRVRFDYQFLNPYSSELASFSKFGRKFTYFESYHLKHSGSPDHGEGSMLVEWRHKEDKYLVHAINVPNGDQNTRSVTNVSLDEVTKDKIESGRQIFFLFEFHKTILGINMRVRHLPTFVEIKPWNNSVLPNFSLIRQGHENELRSFLGSQLVCQKTNSDNPFSSLLLSRIEK
jgi:hypothetical protein